MFPFEKFDCKLPKFMRELFFSVFLDHLFENTLVSESHYLLYICKFLFECKKEIVNVALIVKISEIL